MLGHFVGRQQSSNARPVDRHRFLHEYVHARARGILKMLGPKVRIGGQNGQIDAAVDRLLEGIEPDEPSLGRDVDPLGKALMFLAVVSRFLSFAERLEAGFEPIFEHVGHGPKLHRPFGAKGLRNRARASSAAADQGHFDRLVTRRMDARYHDASQGRPRHNPRTAPQKTPAGNPLRLGQLTIFIAHQAFSSIFGQSSVLPR